MLRPGLVTVEQIESIIGPILRFAPTRADQLLASPGLLPRHYSPRTPLEVATDDGHLRVDDLSRQSVRGWLTWPGVPSAGENVRETLPRSRPGTPRDFTLLCTISMR